MTLEINGEQKVFSQERLSLSELIDDLNLTGQPLLVELNGEALHPQAQRSLELAEGDRLELLRMVAGG